MFLNPHLDEQLQITVQSIERLTAAINNLSREQKKFKKHRCCPCNAPLLTDVPAESYIALHYAGEDFYRCVDEVRTRTFDLLLLRASDPHCSCFRSSLKILTLVLFCPASSL